jgi:hypothetical protein
MSGANLYKAEGFELESLVGGTSIYKIALVNQ